MNDTTGRRRAPAMSPERRRDMIVKAALPLVVEYGTSVTTAQVARAAGIGEGTIFRAFGDKDALLAACMAEAQRPDDTLAHVAAISLDLPLADRLIEASEAMQPAPEGPSPERPSSEQPSPERLRSVGPDPERLRSARGRPLNAREESMNASREALVVLFEPERDQLRLDPERLAGAFQFLIMAAGRGPSPLSSEELVDLFLHGALTPHEPQ
jgi:AcrR family transcriptional regulator